MEDEVIDVEDYEVKETAIVLSDDEEDDDYSKSSNDNNYTSNTTFRTATISLSNEKLIILALVAIVLIAIFALTFC